MNEIEALTEFYTAAVDSLKAKLAESERHRNSLIDSFTALREFIDGKRTDPQGIADIINGALSTPPKGEAKDMRATLESSCTPEIIKYYEELKEDE